MAEHTRFLERLRHDLGRRYSVAHQPTSDPTLIFLLVRRESRPDTLVVEMSVPWMIAVEMGFERTTEQHASERVSYKHLTMLIPRYFADPQALTTNSFAWPGDQAARESVRRQLDPRRSRRLPPASG